ncbi:hypothetical protein Taro_034300 [Colocasia esculenta]|uniref:Carboxymethylenebutenolidase homolog n=1 Tax=Colocasia esculenta TaxID=4460 RepID=A0A843W3P6_COLES|nr:hypothetical protein [Colocasia esculenta]
MRLGVRWTARQFVPLDGGVRGLGRLQPHHLTAGSGSSRRRLRWQIFLLPTLLCSSLPGGAPPPQMAPPPLPLSATAPGAAALPLPRGPREAPLLCCPLPSSGCSFASRRGRVAPARGLHPSVSTSSVPTEKARFRARNGGQAKRNCDVYHQRPSRRSGDAAGLARCSQVKVEGEVDDETCELVNGVELVIGEGDESIRAYLLKAVKNNNGTGILLLSDIFGFEDSCTREFAYRVACSGYKLSCCLPSTLLQCFVAPVLGSLCPIIIYPSSMWRPTDGCFQSLLRFPCSSLAFPGAGVSGDKVMELPFDNTSSLLVLALSTASVLVPDLFRGNPWRKGQPTAELDHWLSRQLPERVDSDIAASTHWMVDEFVAAGISNKLGVIGFCFGGRHLIQTLAHDEHGSFSTGICIYGSKMDPSVASGVKVPMLFVCGDDDPLCPVSVVREMEKSIKHSKVVVYEGRGHGFAHRPESQEEDADAEDAFVVMRTWLHDHLIAN